jgi:hypothetical protein
MDDLVEAIALAFKEENPAPELTPGREGKL